MHFWADECDLEHELPALHEQVCSGEEHYFECVSEGETAMEHLVLEAGTKSCLADSGPLVHVAGEMNIELESSEAAGEMGWEHQEPEAGTG